MTRLGMRTLVALAAGLWAMGCGDEVTVIEPTQLTARIYVAAQLRDQLGSIYVQSAAQVGTGFTVSDSRIFPASVLPGYPVDVGFVPRSGASTSKLIEIVVEARDKNGAPLVQERALANFVPRQQRVLELWLYPCGARPLGTLCAEAGCHGTSCQTCVKDACGPTPTYGASSLTPLDPSAAVDPNKPPPAERGISTATDPSTASCAVTGSSVQCDDGNPCNGKESCAPNARGALKNGCVVSEPAPTCGAGRTCDVKTGLCNACATDGDGDGDGSDSKTCGGNDCDDNDAQNLPAGKEVCDGKDNDCSGVADDGSASASCASGLPAGVTATCAAGACVRRCASPDQVLENGVCVSQSTCPTPNPCAPGSCMAAGSSFSCVCGPGTLRAMNGQSCREFGWRPPVVLEQLDGSATTPRIAMNAAGAALAVWAQTEGLRDNIWARRFAAGTWGMPTLAETLDTDTARSPDVGIDAAGTGVVAFQLGRTVRLARAPVTGAFGAPQLIEQAPTSLLSGALTGPYLSIPPTGIQHAVWYFDGGGLQAHRANGDGTGPAQQLISRETFTFSPQIAANANSAVAVWLQNGATADGDRTVVFAARFTQGAWSTSQRIDTSSMKPIATPEIRARVGIDEAGNALAVWGGSTGLWWTRMSATSGTWTPPVLLAGSAPVASVALSVRPSGDAVAVWQVNSGDRTTLRASLFTAPAAWSAPVSVDGQSDGRAGVPELGSAASGALVAVWAQTLGTRSPIFAATYLPGVGFRPAVRLSDEAAVATSPDVAIDDAGNAIAVWQQAEGLRTNVMASRLE